MLQKSLTFLNYLWQRKKILLFALLFFVALGVLLPNARPIQAACGVADIGACITDAVRPIVTPVTNLYDWFRFTPWSNFYVYPIIWISDFLNLLCYYIATGSARLFSYIMSQIMSNELAITRQAVFLNAWNIVKAWAILLIDLSLIAAALMIILRLWADKAKQLLPQIIIVALLVNFSVVLVGFLIDVSNISMRSLLVGARYATGTDLVNRVNDAWNAIIWPFDTRATQGFANIMLYFSLNLLFDVIYIVLAIALVFFSFILVQRYIILAILFVISPLAFALKIVPIGEGESLFRSWWTHFIKYCFVGLGAAFFLRLSIQLLENFTWNRIGAGNYDDLLPFLMHFSMVIICLIFGLHLTRKASGPIANSVMKGAAVIGAGVLTGGASLAGGTAGAVGLGRLRDAGKDYYGRAKEAVVGGAESLGLVTAGTQSQMKKARLQETYAMDPERAKTLENASLDQKKAIILGQTAKGYLTATEKRDQIHLTQKAFEDGSINNMGLTDKQKKDVAKEAIAHGVSSSIVTKGQPELAELDKKTMELEKRRLIGQQSQEVDPTTGSKVTYTEADMTNEKSAGYALMQEEARKKVAQKKYSEFKVEGISDQSDDYVAEKAKEKTAEGARYLEEAVKRKILSSVGTFTETADYLDHAKDKYGSNALRNAIDSNPMYVEHDTQAIESRARKIATDAGRTTVTVADRDNAKKALIDEGYQRSNTLDLSKDALGQLEFLQNAKSKPLNKALERMPTGKINQLKKFVTLGTPEATKLIAELTRLATSGTPADLAKRAELIRVMAEINLA